MLFLRLFLLFVFLASAFVLVQKQMQLKQEEEKFQALSASVSAPEAPPVPEPEVIEVPAVELPAETVSAPELDVQPQEPTILPQFAAQYESNPDLIGWLTISNTNINYPVMYTPSEPEYYLRRAFDRSDSHSGTPFIGAGGTIDSDSLIIYGHNLNTNTMFGELLQYQNQDFWNQHTTFRFDTVYEQRNYEVFAVVKTRILNQDEEGFRFYYTIGDLTAEEHTALTDWLKAQSLYDTGITPSCEDQILMLCTCSYHTPNGRIVVAARRTALPNPPTE